MLSFKNATVYAASVIALLQAATVFAQSSPSLTENDPPLSNMLDSFEPKVVSDLLIVLDSDGRSHTVQHTLATNGPGLRMRIPGSVVPQEVLFFGPDQATQRQQNNQDPNILALSSGSAFARYQHQYGVEVEQIQADHFVLTTPSIPGNIDIANMSFSHVGTTWVFPSEYELISYTVTDPTIGHWVAVNNTLTFYQLGPDSVELSINYKRKTLSPTINTNACNDTNALSDACSDDIDEDGVPDYRDICVSELGQNNNVFGCEPGNSMLLTSVDFAIGRTYLNVSARHMLDRVAQALIRQDDKYFEIGAHTDNEGAAASNQQLSKKRAAAVRHYLILRGVDPNAIRAEGYGEKYPIRDNASSEGRRANRRIELSVIE